MTATTATAAAEVDRKVLQNILPALPKNVGHLQKESVEIECPSCHNFTMTKVERQAVTLLQNVVAVLNVCLCW